MNKIILLLNILFPLLLNAEQPQRFLWNFEINKSFTIDKFTAQTIIKNGVVIREREIRDYVLLTPVKKIKNNFHLIGRYYSYQRQLNSTDPFQLNEIYSLNFFMDEHGYYTVGKKYIMPSIRNIPIFPKDKITPGYMWQEKGEEIMEFKPPVKIPIDVQYQYAGLDNKKFKNPTAKIVFHYIINYIADHNNADIPYKFIGSSYSTLWYDLQKKLPVYIENLYDIGFIYSNGTVIQYKGKLKGYYNLKRTLDKKEKIKKEMFDKFKKQESDLTIKKSDEGVIIEFKDVYFKYDSALLTKTAKKKLNKISTILKNYKDYNVIIKGHTDNFGSKEYNQKLSEKRALNVLKYLLKEKAFNIKQGSYKGYGEEKPIADNSTKEGRQKNRRVEIFINPE